MEPHAYSVSELMKHAMIALVAGFAHALNERKESPSSASVKIGEFVASVLIASFSGVIFGLISLEFFGEGSYLTLAITGSGGFIGAKALKMISETMVTFLQVVVTKRK